MDCHLATEHLLDYLKDPERHRIEADAAITHIRECSHCKSKIGHLVRALITDEADQMTCQECEALLPDYAQAERDGQANQRRWHSVALHLATCPHCSTEYTALSELVTLAYGERGVEPPYYPVPELSFLREKKTEAPHPLRVPWHLDDLGCLIIEFSTQLLQSLQPPTHAAVSLRSDKSSRTLYQLSLEEEVEDLEVVITAEETRDDPDLCTVIVEVNIPSKGGWPNLAGTEVTLKRGTSEPATRATDAFGKAVFEQIKTDDLAHLVFEITPHTESHHPPSDDPDP